MKINASYLLAAGLLLIGGIWFTANNLGEEEALPVSTPATVKEAARKAIPTVSTRRVSASQHPNVLELYGQTRAAREVNVAAETAGLVAAINVAEGARVKKGQTLCRQDVDARQALVDQAKANMRAIETDLNAAKVLAEKGFQSVTRVNAAQAQMDGAIAALKQAEIEADNVNIRAPFDGVWERQDAEVGDFLMPGMSCGLLVDLSPLEVNVELTESQLGLVERDMPAEIVLATGETVTGKVAYIEARADPATRTFRAELRVPNVDYKLRAGVTGTVRLISGMTFAQQIPGNILTLDDSGAVGVRYLDERNIVAFARVRIIDEDREGLWVTGLPDNVRIIVEGQDFVTVGQEVNPSTESFNNTGADVPLTQLADERMTSRPETP